MQTQDQGFTVDHPIVGQNTGTWERNVFKINEPGEAVQNNGLNKLGGLTNGKRKVVSTETVTYRPWIDENANMYDSVALDGIGAINYVISDRFKGIQALDIIGTNKFTTNPGEAFRILKKTAYNECKVYWLYASEDGITQANTVLGTYTGPTSELLMAAALIRANGADGYVGGAILCTMDSNSSPPTYKLYFNTGASNTLITSANATLFDVAPHFNAWYNGGRFIFQSPIMDANGPQYAWTAPAFTGPWTQTANAAWLCGYVNIVNTSLVLMGTQRTTAGLTQVGSTVTISAVGGISEVANIPEVGYTQGSNAFHGPGFYSALFTDTTGSTSIQAITGHASFNVNTQAAGAGLTETILPDAVGFISPSFGTLPTLYVKMKAANKKPAVITLASSLDDPGAVITEYGGYDLTYLPSFFPYSGLGLYIIYCVNGTDFEVIRLQNVSLEGINWSDSRVDYNVFQYNVCTASNIVDMTNTIRLANYGGFVRCGVPLQDVWSTGVGANTINIQPGNKYTNGVYLGAYTGAASTALPIRVIWLEYWPSIYSYHSAYTNGAAREYSPGTLPNGTVTETNLKYIDTVYLDNPSASFVQNDNLPIPVGCSIDAGIISLPTGVAVQTKLQSDFDGSPYGYCGYFLTGYIETNMKPFVIQGGIYGFDGKNIYSLADTSTQIDTPQVVLQAGGVTYVCSDKDGAYFYRSYDFTLLYFDGGRNFQPVLNLAGLLGTYSSATAALKLTPSKSYSNSEIARMGLYNQNTGDVFLRLAYLAAIGEASNWLRINNGIATIHKFVNVNSNDRYNLKDRAYASIFMNSVGGADNTQNAFYFAYTSAFVDTLSLTYQSPYYGLEEGSYVRVLKYIFMLKVTDPATTDLVVTFKWFTYDSSGTETYTFLANTYTSNNGYVYLEYIPTQQVGHGVSIGLSSTKEVYILGITGHYGQPELALSVNQNVSTS